VRDEPTVPLPLSQALGIADAWQQQGRFAEAAVLLDRILGVAPRHPVALHLRGLVAFRLGQPEAAARLVERALAEGGEEQLFLRNLCSIYERLGRYPEAIAAGERAAVLDPLDTAALHNLSVVHYRRLDLDAASACARAAIGIDPSAAGPHFALAEALLLQGAFAAGWEEYEWRFRIPGTSAPLPAALAQRGQPEWDGRPLPGGRLLLVADQGFGDSIQFCRYIPWAAARCAALALACSPELRPLLAQVAPSAALFTRWEEAPTFDAWCPLSGLPRRHGTRLQNIPAGTAYLRAEPARVAAWRARLQARSPRGTRLVGLVWAGRPEHVNDANRSASLAAFAPLADLPGVSLVSLQRGPAHGQVGAYHGRAPLLALGPEIADFADTAAILACLDVLVSVDTSVAHLAGALGVPAWVLLPYAPDWRWLLGRADTPWYPSLRLFRQPAPLDWHPVVAELAAALAG
jgi:hypothetical protein